MQTHQLPIKVPDLDFQPLAVRKVPPHMPALHFLGAIIGARGTGKTFAMLQLMKMYNTTKTFDKCIIISPTFHADPKYKILEGLDWKLTVYEEYSDALWQTIEKGILDDLDEYDKYLEDLERWRRYMRTKDHDLPKITDDEYGELERLDFKKPTTPWKRGRPTTILILDDLVGSTIYKANCSGPFTSFVIRHRHSLTSVLFLAQIWANAVPRQLRSNLSLLILFKCKSAGIAKQIAQEFATYMTEEQFAHMWDTATAEKHGFLFLNFEGADGEKHRSGFDKAFQLEGTEPPSDPPAKQKSGETTQHEQPNGTDPIGSQPVGRPAARQGPQRALLGPRSARHA